MYLYLGTAEGVQHGTNPLGVFCKDKLVNFHLHQLGHEPKPPLLIAWYLLDRQICLDLLGGDIPGVKARHILDVEQVLAGG